MYIRAEEALSSFRARNGLSCPPGCGACCEGFHPDLLPIEASYLAAWLVRNRPERALEIARSGRVEALNASERGCPLYDPAAPIAHCTVYPGRPLICRLFGFAGTRNRIGLSSYSLCRLMPELPSPRSGRRAWEGLELENGFGLPPLMSDISRELESVSPGDAAHRALLADALPAAISQLLFLTGLGASPETDGNDPVVPPLHRAS